VGAEKVHRKFALEWFANNEEKIKQEGISIPKDASDDWKISVVFSSREKGGMGAATDIEKGSYKSFKKEADKIGILRADIKKHKIPVETPFILLNYLQKIADGERDEQHSRMLCLVMKELAGKMTNKDLYKIAEKEVMGGDFKNKGKYIEERVDTTKGKIFIQKNEELIDREWQKFNKLSYWQQKEFCKRFGISSGRIIANKDDFRAVLLNYAGKNGLEVPVFCGFLDQGYKPHEVKIKGIWFLGTERIIMPRSDHFEEITTKNYDNFVEGVMANYATSNKLRTIEELEVEWENEYGKKIRVETEKQVTELAKSVKKASAEIKRIYQMARDKITAVRGRVKKDSKDICILNGEEKNVIKKIKDNWEQFLFIIF